MKLVLALTLLLMATPAFANEGLGHTIAKYSVLPLYVVGGYTIGHVFGGPIGLVRGVQLWEDNWYDGKMNSTQPKLRGPKKLTMEINK